MERIIQRFENEFPETRISASLPKQSHDVGYVSSSSSSHSATENRTDIGLTAKDVDVDADNDDDDDGSIRNPLRRHGSDVSLASRQAQEEGLMHRFGQRVRRDILRPETLDHAHGTTGHEVEATHIQDLRRRLEALDGVEIREKVAQLGPEAIFEAIGATAKELAWLEENDPEGLEAVKEEHFAALYNMGNQEVHAEQGTQKV